MFILDTNVVSELRKAKADRNVTVWAASVSPGSLFLSAITILELETGILLVERRDPAQGSVLRAWMGGHVLPTFSGRVLAVDTAVSLLDVCWRSIRPFRCVVQDFMCPIRAQTGMP
ncbi:MAG: hypothetical protein K8H84_02670 [Sulfuricella denitrificans]|nr:hypothetical protein [Sulfuricella denitrificans]